MSQTSDPATVQTLGQRIDAVLNPLYAEAEAHRATLAQANEQIATLQQQVQAATQGLETVEGQMAEVVRSLASQDPVLAAVISGSAPGGTATPPPTADATAAQADSDDEPAETVPLDLDPALDKAMVDEASDLLAASPAAPPKPASPPPADIAAAAERAAAAAKLLKAQATPAAAQAQTQAEAQAETTEPTTEPTPEAEATAPAAPSASQSVAQAVSAATVADTEATEATPAAAEADKPATPQA